MNCILMDIKKFLKKLENGQLEIGAGQWELHKDISRLKSGVQELKNLKKDLYQMRLHGLKQTGLIKELQEKINKLEQTPENSKKKKNRVIRSEEVLEITSEASNKESLSAAECRVDKEGIGNDQDDCGAEKGRNKITIKEAKQKGQMDCSSQPFKKLHSPHFSQRPHSSPRNHSILQRYLQDSAKYIDREVSQMSYVSSENSCPSENKNHKKKVVKKHFQNRNDCRSPVDSRFGKCAQNKTINALNTKNRPNIILEKFICPICHKKFALRRDFIRHERTHKKNKAILLQGVRKGFSGKTHLKKRELISQKKSKSFRGFRCSYCDKICSSPEKLTMHLKNCRIITKSRCRKK